MGQILVFKLRKHLTFSAFISWLLSLQKEIFCGNKIANCKPALIHRSFELYAFFGTNAMKSNSQKFVLQEMTL